ncbi:hypothetical protein XFF6166_320004 [Xanthomonas citri pv. fuscans]|nr:hypothetical protein CKU38_01223 [Xanthomonas citri pv. fuscans]SON78570.1 hypothetical protein XFF6166_320004 [Xanthomonas citri pv. fuscans]SOO02878.1 hypothetical protein XFF6960_710025 [Xanthomonas citri pv. fuscans]SOO11313.1 hypothetical protein XFF6970_740004 [Xanthomonas citri pv. fuscans]SOO16804.1 hypothetical protein XFF7766_880018 [Xanthomonas citri pv. fuscans]
MIADALGELRDQVVFLGGAVVGLLVSDPLAENVRATYDVDAVVNLDWARFRGIEARVESQGFAREMQSGVVCRWVHEAWGVIFDLMPVDAGVLGFSNRWYAHAVETAQVVALSDRLSIRLVTATAFVATKLEAFVTRGNSDFLPVTTWRTCSMSSMAGPSWWKSLPWSMQIFGSGLPTCSRG